MRHLADEIDAAKEGDTIPRGDTMTNAELAKWLRGLADGVGPADTAVSVTVIEHRTPVTDESLGGMVVDAKWRGRSIVIHLGDLDFANDEGLAERLDPHHEVTP